MEQVHWGICELAPLLRPYKRANKTEANQNRTDDGTDPPGTLCSLEKIGPVNNIYYWCAIIWCAILIAHQLLWQNISLFH